MNKHGAKVGSEVSGEAVSLAFEGGRWVIVWEVVIDH